MVGTDVGGGNTLNTAPHSLANISLCWMIEQIVQSNTHILFNYDAFPRWNIPTSIGYHPPEGKGDSTSNNGDVAALYAEDATQPLTDELLKKPLWWILEILPMLYTYQNAQTKWVSTFG